MRATAIAQPNIALIKYWGKRDVEQNLPAVGSISVTLAELQTTMLVDLESSVAKDTLVVNGEENPQLLPRISACLDNVLGSERAAVLVDSSSNFPIAAGLASSASAFAAVTVAATAAAELELPRQQLARMAGRASGSAARSLFGGFVELQNDASNIDVRSLCDARDWPLQVVVAITETAPKPTGSTEAMEISRKTSPFYDSWIDKQGVDLATAREAISARDFGALAMVSEHNCLKMHSVMWASRPPMVYWNSATMRCMQMVRALQADGCGVFFTIDAGPQVKAVCLPEDTAAVTSALESTEGVKQLMVTGLGDGARRVEQR
ncbi:MAG: diphosphomevalonate decarboxylase [Gammaproteobacteria bacterium]|nr:diphosphomevalonate decarboxylase [Gammaproteobacteria bacterium]